MQLLLQMVDGWLGRGGSILALYRLLGSIQVLEIGSMGTFSLIVITQMNHRTAVGFNGCCSLSAFNGGFCLLEVLNGALSPSPSLL